MKCDEGRPNCSRCLRLGLECGGYTPKPRPVRFKVVQSTQFVPKQRNPRPASQTRDVILPGVELKYSIIPPPTQSKDSIARSFFITHFAMLGRDISSSHGFFEALGPLALQERRGSTVCVVLNALSISIYSMWRDGPPSLRAPSKPMLRAFSRLQVAVRDPAESLSQATILAALVLQFHENLWSVFQLRRATRTHHDGAVALLRHQWATVRESVWGKYLLCTIVHTEVSAAIREKRLVPEHVRSWVTHDLPPLNIGSKLDEIGISVASLQYRLENLQTQNQDVEVERLWAELTMVRDLLLDWSLQVPNHWQPIAQDYHRTSSRPILSYLDSYHIYPSVQIASIWNLHRCYLLIVFKVAIALVHLFPQANRFAGESFRNGYHNTYQSGDKVRADSSEMLLFTLESSVQEIVDDICRSVPFFMGNRTTQTRFEDLTSGHIMLPGYHSMAGEPPRDPAGRPVPVMSRSEHNRHAITQGGWHAISPLSHLVGLASDPYGAYVARALRPGQLDWAAAQLVRVAVVMGVDLSALTRRRAEGRHPAAAAAAATTAPGGPDGVNSATDGVMLADMFRESLCMTSGS